MKNPYMRHILLISLLLSFIYVLTIILQYNIISHTSLSIDTSRISEGIVRTTSSTDLLMRWMTILLYFVGFIQIVLSYVFSHDSGSGLILGITMQYIGPMLVFISWFILLYLVTKLYAKLKMSVNNGLSNQTNFDTNAYKISTRLLVIICIVFVIILTIGNLVYSSWKVKKSFESLKDNYSTIKVSDSLKKVDVDYLKDWKIYKDNNVEFMYPSEFTNGIAGPGGGVMFYSKDKKVTLNLYPCCYPIPDGFDYENMKSTGFEMTRVSGDFAVIKYSPLEIDGRIATKKGLIEVLMHFVDIQESQKYKDLFNKIFLTFKIL